MPKLFISYSWSTPEHEQWVIDLATEVRSSGVDVILDKWDLREGHDAFAFMEKMVTDPTITKVLIVCDRAYVSKADGRAGGVGTETQIISREVYEKQSQDKFVAVVAEKDESGKPYLPTYYKSRIYIDLSESDRYAEGFEKLVRWVFGKPLYVRPEIGKPPAYVADAEIPMLGTSALAKRVIDGLKNDKAYSRGALDEYLTLFSENLERFRITSTEGEPDDRIVKSIEEFTPSRNEFISVVVALIQYGEFGVFGPRLHRFYESLIPYLSRPSHVSTWNETDFDNFKFVVHELFLYTLSLHLRAEDFRTTGYLLAQAYYVPGNSDYGKNATVCFTVFRAHLNSLEIRNKRLKLNRLSLRADLLEQRSKVSGILFRHLLQADFLCFMRAELSNADTYDRWYPESLLYATRHYGPFEIFARSASKVYLAQILPLLGAADTLAVKAKLEEFAADRRSLPRWDFESINPSALLGFDQLGTKA
jgi:hypothetical protein